MKLLFFASDYSIGLSELLFDQLSAINNSNANYIAVAGEKEQIPGLWDKAISQGINLLKIPGLDVHSLFSALVNTLCNISKKENIGVIHVQNNWQLALASSIKIKLWPTQKIKIAYTLHGFRHNHPVKSIIAKTIIGCALNIFADIVICMTEYLRKEFWFLGSKRFLLPLGISNDCFTNSFEFSDSEGLQIIFPGQFRKGKNQDMVIRAFAKHIKRTGDNESHLILPGNGILLNQFKTLTNNLGIETRVSFPGFLKRQDVIELYKKSNVAIVASNSETFGQSIVEPFVLGRCILSTRVGIAPEIIKDGENGFLFSTENQLSNIITKLYNDNHILKIIGKHNFNHRNKFLWSEITKKYSQKMGL